MKSHKILWSLALVIFWLHEGTASSGAEDATEVNGALGESVTFELKTSPPFKLISWLKSEGSKDPSNIALLKPGEQCTPDILFPGFQGRLSAPEDCRSLQVRDLRRDDSGRYLAQINRGGASEPLREAFDLRVYKRLSEADLTVRCHKTGNGTRQLNCSAGPWEDDVVFGWEDESKAEPWGQSATRILRVNDEDDLNATCRARNPIGEASRTVSVQEICAEVPSSSGVYVAIALGLIALMGLLVILVCWWKKKAAHRKHLDCAGDKRLSQAPYAEVTNVPRDGEMQPPRQRGRPAKVKSDGIQTIYTTVDHCKQNLLQTDDEKMRKGERGHPEQSEKTIYSEISNSQESEDQNLKTIYETVKNPQLPRGAEYNVII
ncbi:SLAM family member 9 isoform X1 [Pogona vitticeps]